MTDNEQEAETKKLSAVEAAEAAGRREGLDPNQVRVKGGLILTFKPLSAYDQLMIEEEAKQSAGTLIKSNPQRYALLVAWRAAVNGGYEMPFHDFAKQIPLVQISEVAERVGGILGNAFST